MRSMVSNFRGFKSESGTVTPYSASSALTRSGNAKESIKPESNKDSSGAGDTGFFATDCRISRIFACLLIPSLSDQFLADFYKRPVMFHQILKNRPTQQPVPRRRKVDIIPLGQ